MTSNGLLAPPLTIRTSFDHSEHPNHEYASSSLDNGISLQVPQPPSPTSESLGGDTLRSRSDSFNSFNTGQTARSRANSNLTKTSSRWEGDDISPEEALQPGKGDKEDFKVEDNPFAFSPGQLNKTLNPKSLAAFRALGGPVGLEQGLQTDLAAGLSVDETSISRRVSLDEAKAVAKNGKKLGGREVLDQQVLVSGQQVNGQFHDRRRVFNDNRLPAKKSANIWKLFWNAFNDRVLIILTIAAVISLALGIYEAVGQTPAPGEGKSLDWVEGLAIEVAVIIVVLVTGLTDYRREKQFGALNAKKEDRQVKAIRSGKSIMISVFDVMVGDILHIESGDSIPADGVLVSGHGIRCDESSATGESDAMKKTPSQEVWNKMEEGTATSKLDPFIISGSKVLEGVGTYLVTSVGVNSSFGKIMMSLQTENEPTPLQVKLGRMANWIGYLGTAAAGILFVVLLLRFLAGLSDNPRSPAMKGSQFLDILIVAITVIVVAVPEGLPVAVTLALSFATKRMLKENNLVRHLRACETMGNATTVCSDKTGTLTQNKMTVVAGLIGSDIKFGEPTQAQDDQQEIVSISAALARLPASARNLVLQSSAINSTAFEGEEDGKFIFIGSKTETAILAMAKDHLGMGPVAEERSGVEVVQLIPFDSERKCMGTVIRLASGTYRLLVKGAAEILLQKATTELASMDAGNSNPELRELTPPSKEYIQRSIDDFAGQSLRTIAMLYKDFAQWPPQGVGAVEHDSHAVKFEDIFHDMTFLTVIGIQDPLRDGVSRAVQQCQEAGIKIRMVTGDNIKTATAIASQCGIYSGNGIVMEGPEFRQLSDSEMDSILPRLDVLARSSPEDKRILVARLKHLGETVAVTGDGTNDGPALKLADVGFSMGVAGTEVAKEASAIILMDDNFSSIVKAIMWGRSVNDAVAKFLQFQLTVNITAVLLAFVSAVSSVEMHSVLSAVQLLWVNLIMDTFAALALATDAPTEKILKRKPAPKSASLITTNMWKMIIGQAVYQLVVTFVLYFAGSSILGYSKTDGVRQIQLDTMVFNAFVWMQIFNEFNNRRLDNGFNIFEGVTRNYFFIVINMIMVGGQIMIIFVGGKAFQITRIDGTQWAISILVALPCLIWAVLLRCIPDKYAAAFLSTVSKIWFALMTPIYRAFAFVFRPVGKWWASCSEMFFSPFKRYIKRTTAKIFGEKEEQVDVQGEELTGKLQSPQHPVTPPELPLQPPPITLTAA